MAPNKRALPKDRNPLLEPAQCPPYDELVGRRRLGQTDYKAKNRTKVVIDFVHLKAPLPPGLQGAELFGDETPEAYYLMRRSSDGFISATGMFKAAFPRATRAEEQAERSYLFSLDTTSVDESAGNVWIPPTHALQIAELYGMETWVRALLDPSPVQRASTDPKRHIAEPPIYHPPTDNIVFTPPSIVPSTGHGRVRLRSDSPSRPSPAKKVASPRKRMTKSAAAAAAVQANDASPHEAPDASIAEENIHVDISSVLRTNGDVQTNYTDIKVDLPSFPGVPEPERPEEMIARAQDMVDTAQRVTGIGPPSMTTTKKRKADDFFDDDDDDESDQPTPPSKRTKRLEEELKKEKVKARALIGLTVTLAIGAIIPYVF